MSISLERAKDRICQLEDAITRLDLVQQHLTKNASEICREVQGSINFSVDCLRSREVSLLEEVNQVRLMKEESLEKQQGSLKQAVNILCTAVTLVTENPASEKHLVDTLDRLTQLELSPEETPYIGFRVDHFQTREHLLNYGRVDTNGLPLANAFVSPDKPSASLPRHFEEYDDGDHHVFYKTLQDIQRPDATTSIRVNIPKLSQRPEDWLQKKSAPVQSENKLKRPSTLSATHSSGSGKTSRLQESSKCEGDNSCSLNNWLSLIKNQGDLEEEHYFEIVDNTSFKFTPTPCKNAGSSDDLEKWLKPASPSPQPAKTGDLFDHITKDTTAWLVNVCHQLAGLTTRDTSSVASGGDKSDIFSHISSEPSTWLRCRAPRYSSHSSQLQSQADLFSHISKDRNKWLKSTAGASATKRKMETNQNAEKQEDLSHNKWLLRGGVPAATQEVKPQSVAPRSASFQSINPWLVSGSCEASGTDRSHCNNSSLLLQHQFKSCSDINEKSSSKTDMNWLLQNMCDISIDTISESHPIEDGDKCEGVWLSRDYSCAPVEMDAEPANSSSVEDLCNWLLIPEKAEPIEDVCGEVVGAQSDKSSTDSWSVYSVPHSLSSDQFAKDVAVADDYLNKWLL